MNERMKPVARPSMAQFDDLIAEARKQARKAGVKRPDVAAAVGRVRSRRRESV